jgi:hypothetical protein
MTSTITQVTNRTIVSMPRVTSAASRLAGIARMIRNNTASRFSRPGRSRICTG